MKLKLTVIVLVLLVANIYVRTLRSGSPSAGPPPLLEDIPLSVNGYAGSELELEPEELEVLGSDKVLYRSYSHPELDQAWLFLGYFGSSQENSQIHSPKHCYPGSGWEVYGESTAQLKLAGRPVRVKMLNITDGDNERIVFYWFVTRSGIITNEFGLKWDQMKNALGRKSLSAVFVRFSAEQEAGESLAETEAKLKNFAETLTPYLESALAASLGPGAQVD